MTIPIPHPNMGDDNVPMIPLRMLMQHVKQPAPIGIESPKPPRNLAEAEGQLREVMWRLARGASRESLEQVCSGRLNLARIARIYGMIVHMGVDSRGPRYEATRPGEMPASFEPGTLTMVL